MIQKKKKCSCPAVNARCRLDRNTQNKNREDSDDALVCSPKETCEVRSTFALTVSVNPLPTLTNYYIIKNYI